jgi:hypothetical protein
MSDTLIERAFQKIGARVKIGRRVGFFTRQGSTVALNIRHDNKGEYFDLRHDDQVIVRVLDTSPDDRHLVLMTLGPAIEIAPSGPDPAAAGKPVKARFLCGHDERHWFVAAIPEESPITTVSAAKAALQPTGVSEYMMSRRRNKLRAKVIRQGEWFFVPVPIIPSFDPKLIRKHEPLQRNDGGKPHFAEELYRTGGTDVWVSAQHPAGLTDDEYAKLITKSPKLKNLAWRRMRRDPEAYVRGRITHPDHSTVILDGWHRVYMNSEPRARARSAVVFLD